MNERQLATRARVFVERNQLVIWIMGWLLRCQGKSELCVPSVGRRRRRKAPLSSLTRNLNNKAVR